MQEETMEEFDAVLDRLTKSYPALSPQIRKVAGYVLENPGEVATRSMRKVAASAGVPPPTMPRLAKAVGYDTYEAFRDVYRRSIQTKAAAYPERAQQLQASGGSKDVAALWSAFRTACAANIERIFMSLDGAAVERIADRLIAAQRVFVVGMQASFPFANYFHYVGRMAYPNWLLLGSKDGALADDVVTMGAEDALVAISFQPYAKDTICLARLAAQRGTPVIGITDSRTSPLAACSTTVITVPTGSPQFFDSYVATTALIEALVGFIIVKSGPDAVENIDRVERCRRALGEYWDEE
jgi:DNA-binding MurR/RpiR family transcriptional regulator